MATYTEEELNEVRRQTASELKALIDSLDARVASAVAVVAAERDAAMAKLVDIQAKLDDPASTKDDVKYESKKSDKARKRAAIRAELDRIDADKAAKQAELDELDAKASGPKK